MFKKLVCVESAGRMTEDSLKELASYAKEVVLYDDIPGSHAETEKRIGDADAILVSFTSGITGSMLQNAPNLRYVGMCCSLYGPENVNVDIIKAKELGITVTGCFHYGDKGVQEFVVSELIRLLHGFGSVQWRDEPQELTGQKVGVLGIGNTGAIVSGALRYLGADVCYYARTRRLETETELGIGYMPLDELLQGSDILCCCLTKNVVLLGEREFELFGDGKILVNISLAPAFDLKAFEAWLGRPGNFAIGDSTNAIDPSGRLHKLPNVISYHKTSGMTAQARSLLGQKVVENIRNYLGGQ